MRFLLLAIVCALPAFASQPLKPVAVADKVADRFTPAPYTGQRVEGLLGERMRVNLEGRLLHVDEKGILKGFQQRPGEQDWIGEHAGKFLHAATNTWLYTGDERLKALMDRVVRALLQTQLPDGYLGTYLDEERWTSWDVWVHKYDLIGLISYYQATGYEPALDASRKIGDLLCRTFGAGPGQRDIISGDHVGMAATSVLEPMVNLYRFTGDRKYLDFCEYLVRSWGQANGPKIIDSLLATQSVFRTADAKAYEMMSNLVGLAELYRVTGNPVYLQTEQTAWKDIAAHRLYVTGTTSANEHFADDYVLPGEQASNVGEGCATVTWLQLTWQLLRLTGEPQYAEQLEHTVYNALLGAQDPRTGDICYFTPLNGKKSPGPGINCCVSSEPRGISMIPQLTWGTLGDGAAVLFYVPGRVTVRTRAGDVSIQAKTDFPVGGTVSLKLNPIASAKFPLYLRVPEWTKRFTATAGGESYHGTPGKFLAINREWKPGDEVSVDMDLTVRVIPGGPSYPYSVAIARGPQILALEQSINRNLLDLQAAGPRGKDVKLVDARSKLPPAWPGGQAYSLDGVAGGKARELLLVPFAEASTCRVWLLKP
jgi:DUF1680 family protein